MNEQRPSNRFSVTRFVAVVRKEFVQMRRDRLTFAMMIGIPLIQLIMFGFAINSDPKALPTAIVAPEASPFSRSLVTAMQNTGYFRVISQTTDIREAEHQLERGDVTFILELPADFARRIVRGEIPFVRIEVDASDPAATSNALAAMQQLAAQALAADFIGPLSRGRPSQGVSPVATPGPTASISVPFDLRLHRRYNPEGITQYNIVPGLLGVILTMTMIMMTSVGITREIERGTMENLLATPVLPLEVMTGKIVPYIVVGYVQIGVTLLGAFYVFSVPMIGSLMLLLASSLIFILANLTVGITFSSVARNQTQAIQMSFFFLLPSILLSGFMFPFDGMPEWAQTVGTALPLTHFLRIVRGIMLKGHDAALVWQHVWPLLVFTGVVLAIGLKRFRRTLD